MVLGEEYAPNNPYQPGHLNSLVRRLRTKLEPDPAHPRYILTSRRQGYWLNTGSE